MRSFRELMARLPANGDIRHALRRFNFGMTGSGSPPSVLELARTLGFDVRLTPMPKNIRGRLVQDSFADSGFVIEVNEGDDVRTRRWTVLHEMMHAFLHKRDDPFAAEQYRAGGAHFYDLDELAEEREANAFVETLIFGENALSAARSLFGDDVVILARHFGVTDATMARALKSL